MSGSVERVRAALLAAGHPDTVALFPAGVHTAADAARAIGCEVAQIAKSIIFRSGDRAVLVIASGVNRVDAAKVSAAVGLTVAKADAGWVREATGFAIGGVAPIGHIAPPLVVVDEDLLALDPVWAAAGSPSHVFKTRAGDIVRLSGGKVARIKQEAAASGA